MKPKLAVFLVAAVLIVACGFAWFWKQGPLDLSKDEEPFCSIAMPPKSVFGQGYMDGGSVAVIVIDREGKHHEVTFPIDRGSIRNPYPTALWGNVHDPTMIPLKNPERAKEIAIRLLRDHGTSTASPATDGKDTTAAALSALSNPPRTSWAGRLRRRRAFSNRVSHG